MYAIRKLNFSWSILIAMLLLSCNQQSAEIWKIGDADQSASEFALAPDRFEEFLDFDFGWEDKYFLVGHSDASSDWPYILPGPADQWGGTWGTAGWRSHTMNILFGVEKLSDRQPWKLIVTIADNSSSKPPLFKISVNGTEWKYQLDAGSSDSIQLAAKHPASPSKIEIVLPLGLVKKGGNNISLTTLQGSWLLFDQVRIEGPSSAKITTPQKVFVREVTPAEYQIVTPSNAAQPLLVDVEHLAGTPLLSVLLDGEIIFTEALEAGRYTFEAPMPVVTAKKNSRYEIRADNTTLEKGKIVRNPAPFITPAGYADTKMGTAHSRWMIAPGPWMPFSMVKISPDNQNPGWQSGYDPIFESIGCFSHIHEWTMAGLGFMPTNGPLKLEVGDEKDPDSGYRSRIDVTTEHAPIGYYRAHLTDYNIVAELTSTTRGSFHRYTFPGDRNDNRILIDLKIPAEYNYKLQEIAFSQTGPNRLEGFSHQLSENVWSGGVSQEYTVHFVIEFDQPIKGLSFWTEKGVHENQSEFSVNYPSDAGAIVTFNLTEENVVQVRTGISYVSIENAALNLSTEITRPFNWDFEAVRQAHVDSWDDLLGRVKITTSDRMEKRRFYTNMYRALCSRNIFSDVDGSWVDADEIIRTMDDPMSPALGCDAFWNTFWNLNQFWNLVTPEWSSRWVKSQLAMYDAGGWLAKGPAGMEYIPVMVAEHEIPLIVGAYQMGIRDFDAEKAFEAAVKMQTTSAQAVGGGFAGNRDLNAYLRYKYVPYDKGRFSNTMEYAYDDWTVAQFAKALGKETEFEHFSARGNYWKNAIDTVTGYARMRNSAGEWLPDFDPFQSGRNYHYVEGNAWQLTFFVPQDIPALADLIGKERFIERLEWGFKESDKLRFNGKRDQYWDYPVAQGNQQSMHFAFLFNWVGKPWLTQKWSRAITNRYYGHGLSNAYLGDEDQGQMSAWFVMAALGLFQTDGGCSVDPVYEIASPLFPKVTIDLGHRYGRGAEIIIEARNASRNNKYVQSAELNGQPLKSFAFKASELLGGGTLVLEMGPEPNKQWGIEAIP